MGMFYDDWKKYLPGATLEISKETRANGEVWYYAYVIVTDYLFWGLLPYTQKLAVRNVQKYYSLYESKYTGPSPYRSEGDAREAAKLAIATDYEDYLKHKVLKTEKL